MKLIDEIPLKVLLCIYKSRLIFATSNALCAGKIPKNILKGAFVNTEMLLFLKIVKDIQQLCVNNNAKIDKQLIDVPWILPKLEEKALDRLYGGAEKGEEAKQEYLDFAGYKNRKACR